VLAEASETTRRSCLPNEKPKGVLRRRGRHEALGEAVLADRVDGQRAGTLLGDDEVVSVGGELHLGGARRGALRGRVDPGIGREASVVSQTKARDVVGLAHGPARVEDVHEVAVHRDADRHAAAGGNPVDQLEASALTENELRSLLPAFTARRKR
jgi:hypothetical protein